LQPTIDGLTKNSEKQKGTQLVSRHASFHQFANEADIVVGWLKGLVAKIQCMRRESHARDIASRTAKRYFSARYSHPSIRVALASNEADRWIFGVIYEGERLQRPSPYKLIEVHKSTGAAKELNDEESRFYGILNYK
jgi:hypothetical protein